MTKYIWVKVEGKWIKEHRFVMEQFLKRKLKSQELIHHINGIKNDNRIENLMIVTPKNHRTIHAKAGFERNLPDPIPQELFTLNEVSEYLRISKSTLIRRIRRGEIKVVYLRPRVPRVPKAEIERILAGER